MGQQEKLSISEFTKSNTLLNC